MFDSARASYRELLGTAETIIEMDGKIQKVEAHLGNLGERCNTRLLEKKTSNLTRWDMAVGAVGIFNGINRQILSKLINFRIDTERYVLASQLAVLRSCPEAISRLLKGSSSVLLAAKVLVISRLLHTKLSQRSRPPPYLETLRNRLAALRRRILATIDKSMKSPGLIKEALVEAMCAFSLATSSSPTDVLRHFHHVRMEAISEQGREKLHSHEGVLDAMRLYISTLKDTRAIFPGSLSQALEGLKAEPLLKNQDLHSLLELNLDLHERWIEDDVKTFTPYIRLDDLQKSDSEKMLRQWARRALSSLINDLRNDLEGFTDTLAIMDLRRQLFELWFSNQHQCTGVEPSEVIDGLRDVINTRWTSIIETQLSSLEGLGLMIRKIVQNWPRNTVSMNQSLWSSTVLSMDVSHGGSAFREALIAKSRGIDDVLREVFDRYTVWLNSVETIGATIAKMQALKWEDAVSNIEEEDDSLNDKQILLSGDNPQVLQKQCSNSVQTSFHRLETILESVAEGLDELSDGSRAVFLLRAWRDIRQRMPKSYQHRNLGLKSIVMLQKVVAKTVLRDPIQRGKKRIAKVTRQNKVPGKPLWEGDPSLPILPSPWVFRLLRDVISAMAEIGSDMWSTDATNTLKKELRSMIVVSIEDSSSRAPQPSGHTVDTSNIDGDGFGEGAASDSVSHSGQQTMSQKDATPDNLTNGAVHEVVEGVKSPEVKIQQAFDLLYLSHATSLKPSEQVVDAYASLQSTLQTDLDLAPESLNRMKRAAEDYWKRTSLLFALLDPGL